MSKEHLLRTNAKQNSNLPVEKSNQRCRTSKPSRDVTSLSWVKIGTIHPMKACIMPYQASYRSSQRLQRVKFCQFSFMRRSLRPTCENVLPREWSNFLSHNASVHSHAPTETRWRIGLQFQSTVSMLCTIQWSAIILFYVNRHFIGFYRHEWQTSRGFIAMGCNA